MIEGVFTAHERKWIWFDTDEPTLRASRDRVRNVCVCDGPETATMFSRSSVPRLRSSGLLLLSSCLCRSISFCRQPAIKLKKTTKSKQNAQKNILATRKRIHSKPQGNQAQRHSENDRNATETKGAQSKFILSWRFFASFSQARPLLPSRRHRPLAPRPFQPSSSSVQPFSSFSSLGPRAKAREVFLP